MSAAARPDRPIPNSYWVREGRFAAGEYPGALDPREAAAKVRALIEAGVDCFIDLTQRRDGLAPYEQVAHEQARALGRSVRRESHPIMDMSVPRRAAEMAAILDAIDDALDEGRTVYVHCWGGIGRTGTVVGCWLVRHGLTGQGALDQIADVVAARGEELDPHRVAPDSPPAGLRAAVGRAPPPLAGVAGPERRQWAG